MLRSANELKGYTIEATDGDIGEVVQFYFDDEKWTIRYLVADTGGWLMGRRVLISPAALGRVDWNARKLHVNMNKERVENSPGIDTDRPVSRQHETAYYNYYGYPYYWSGPYVWGPVPYPAYPPAVSPTSAAAAGDATSVDREVVQAEQQQEDVHLRSTHEVTNYYIEATDGDIGHVEDFLIEDETWSVRYIVVDTRNWWPGKKVLISPEWIRSVNWSDSRVHVAVPRDKIENAPEYDSSSPLTRDYEARLHKHYGQSEYWNR